MGRRAPRAGLDEWFSVADIAKTLDLGHDSVYKVFQRLKRAPDWRGYYRKHKGRWIMHPALADRVAEYVLGWNRPKSKRWRTPKQLDGAYPGVTAARVYWWVREGRVRHKLVGRYIYANVEDVVREGRRYANTPPRGYVRLRDAAKELGVSVTWLRNHVPEVQVYHGGMPVGYVDLEQAREIVSVRYRRLTEAEQRRLAALKGIRVRKLNALRRAVGGELSWLKNRPKALERRINRLKSELARLERDIMALEEKQRGGDSLAS